MPKDSAGTSSADGSFGRALGARLRAARAQQHLSLHGVQRKSDGRWKAVVIGSYERGDRAISVERLAELADFYGVAMTDLLPRSSGDSGALPRSAPLAKVVLNVARLAAVTDPEAAQFAQFVSAIQRNRGSLGGTSVAIRRDDMRTLALIYDTSEESLTERLVRWQVLAPDSVILDGEP
jgi:transcriptional regulator with XRE-family HTH domain